MKSIRTIATIALTMVVLAFPVFADCGEMGNGNRCLIQNPTTVEKPEKKTTVNFETEIADLVRNFFGKLFG